MEYGNLAYKNAYEPNEIHPQQNKTKRNHRQMRSKKKYLRRIYAIAAVALSASFMISEFVTVKETQQQITSLTKQLAAAESVTSQKLFDMEQSVDLAKIEEEATTRLGMQRPEKYQTIYVNVKNDDVTEKTAGDVESFSNRIMSALKNFVSHIVEFFSIE